MIKYSGLSTLANAWTCYTHPTPVPHLGDNAPPALSSMSFLSASGELFIRSIVGTICLSRAQRKMQGHQETDAKPKSTPPPPLLHSEHLNLIFEAHSLVNDQIFRVVHVSQRLDMLYAAYSSATPRWQCPTCTQLYVIPVSSGKAKDDCEDFGE